MPVEQFRGYVASLVAAAAVIGGAIGAAWAWYVVATAGVTAELAIVMSVFTGLISAGSTFLFVAEGASRASYAAERSFTSGQNAATTANAPLAPLAESVTINGEPARSGATVGEIPSAPLDDATPPTP